MICWKSCAFLGAEDGIVAVVDLEPGVRGGCVADVMVWGTLTVEGAGEDGAAADFLGGIAVAGGRLMGGFMFERWRIGSWERVFTVSLPQYFVVDETQAVQFDKS